MLSAFASALAEEAGFDEYELGVEGEQEVGFMTMAMVYFQPVDMAPADLAAPKEGSDLHIEVDLTANENPYGFPVDGWVPYLSIDYVIKDSEGKEVVTGSMMPMAASDGPHYGNNIALPEGEYAKLGVIPQGRSAIDTLGVLENVLLPQQLRGEKGDAKRALGWLEALGMAELRDARPAELSGGELRRMAIARALAGNPEIILADEPTGDLDDENTRAVLALLRRSAVEDGKTVLLVTHDGEALPYGTRIYRMESGGLKTDGY